jgi:ubiquinone/menaquinone biosynthesis C-methylase UbiE
MGFLEKWFHQCNFYGLDIESKVIHQAKENGIRANLLLASAEEMPFPDQAFDVVISLHMVEHLKEPQRFFEEAYRVMRPGGLLAFATPNPEGIGSRVMKKIGAAGDRSISRCILPRSGAPYCWKKVFRC